MSFWSTFHFFLNRSAFAPRPKYFNEGLAKCHAQAEHRMVLVDGRVWVACFLELLLAMDQEWAPKTSKLIHNYRSQYWPHQDPWQIEVTLALGCSFLGIVTVIRAIVTRCTSTESDEVVFYKRLSGKSATGRSIWWDSRYTHTYQAIPSCMSHASNPHLIQNLW